jgi:hypothetical protein
MTTDIASTGKPEEEELTKKQAELSQLEGELAERELRFATLQGEVGAFERRYVKTVGVLYAELDEINARLTERLATKSGSEQAKRVAKQARQQADESRATVYSRSIEAQDFTPSQELKSLYREVAKRIHPDLASEPEDRAKREELMAKANQAYQEGDAALLRIILEEYESSPESVQGGGVAADLVRVIRKIKQVKIRLSHIEQETQKLLDSDIAKLKVKAEELEKERRNLLNELANRVREQIAASRRRLDDPLE